MSGGNTSCKSTKFKKTLRQTLKLIVELCFLSNWKGGNNVCDYHFVDECESGTNDWVSTVQIQNIQATVELHNVLSNLNKHNVMIINIRYLLIYDFTIFSSYVCLSLLFHLPLTCSLLE